MSRECHEDGLLTGAWGLIQRGVNPRTVAHAPSGPGYCVGLMAPPVWRRNWIPPMRRAQYCRAQPCRAQPPNGQGNCGTQY